REGQEFVRADFLRSAGPAFQGRVTAVEVTAQHSGNPLKQRGRRLRDPLKERGPLPGQLLGREPLYGVVSVGEHLLGSMSAQTSPDYGGPGLGGGVSRPGRVPVLPAIERISPSLGLGRPRHYGG